jgi:hypothetical protein
MLHISAIVLIALVLLIIFSLNPLGQTLSVQAHKELAQHEHVSLTLIKDGHNQTIPYGIGIRPDLWMNHSLDKYRGIEGESPLHTHSFNDFIHVESNSSRQYTFGDFLSVWGLDQSKIVKVTSNNENIEEYKNIVLNNGTDIKLFINTVSPNQIDNVELATYRESDMSIQYPSNWVTVPNNSEAPPCFASVAGEVFHSIVGFFPNENDYLDSPQIFLEVDHSPSNATTLAEFTRTYLRGFTDVNITESIPVTIAGNPGHKVVYEYYVEEFGEDLPYKTMELWTIKDDKLYFFTYDAYDTIYPDYLPVIHNMIDSLQIDKDAASKSNDESNISSHSPAYGIVRIKNYGCLGATAPAPTPESGDHPTLNT